MVDHAPQTILRRATYVSLSTMAARFFTALTGILIARAVGPASFGVYAAVWALVELSTNMTEIGLITSLKREGSHHPDRIPFLLGNTLAVRATTGLAVLLGAALVRGMLVRNPDAARIFVPLGLTALSIICTDSFFAVLQVEGRQRAVAGFVTGRALIFFLGVVVLTYLKADLVTFAWYQGVLYAITTLLTVAYVRLSIPLSLRLSHVPQQLQGALPFATSEILYGIYLSLPLLCLSRLGTEEMVGYFAVAQRFVSLGIAVGISATHEAFLPALFRLHSTNLSQFRLVAASSHRIMTGAGFLGACLLFIFAEPVLILLQGEEYRPSVFLLRVLCWYALLTYATLTPDNALTAGERMGTKIVIQAFIVVATLIAAITLIPLFGGTGACLAALTGAALTFGLQLPCAFRAGLMPLTGFWGLLVRGLFTVVAAITIVYFSTVWIWIGALLFTGVVTALWGVYLKQEMTCHADAHKAP